MLNWIVEHYTDILIVLGALELLLRLIPTMKNISIVDGLKSILDSIIPNISKEHSDGAKRELKERAIDLFNRKIKKKRH